MWAVRPTRKAVVFHLPSDGQTELRLGLEFVVQCGQRDPQKPDGLWSRHLALQETTRFSSGVVVLRFAGTTER